MIKVGIGQDSHRIIDGNGKKPLMLGGVDFNELFHLQGNSDSDVVLHALTNAVSGITGVPVLGRVADEMCKKGQTDSKLYVKRALEDLRAMGYEVNNVSLSMECQRPRIFPKIQVMRESIASCLSLEVDKIAITATSGEGLTDFGKGLGIQAFCAVTAVQI